MTQPDTSYRFLVGIPLFTAFFWLAGSYVQLNWVWFANIENAGARATVLVTYLVTMCMFISCPMLFPYWGCYD